ncbi:MAG TPA: hypothetical protein PK289_13730, partial [Bacteroidia bacterium]|nr:hypothetical protein [Bacteroidia bacterium]
MKVNGYTSKSRYIFLAIFQNYTFCNKGLILKGSQKFSVSVRASVDMFDPRGISPWFSKKYDIIFPWFYYKSKIHQASAQ